MSAVVQGFEIFVKVIGITERRPYIRRCPRCGTFPVHEQHEQTRIGLFGNFVDQRKTVGIRIQGIRVHRNVHIMNTADGIGDDKRVVCIPVGQIVIVCNFRQTLRQVFVKPGTVDLCRRFPAACDSLDDQREISFVVCAVINTAVIAEPHFDTFSIRRRDKVHDLDTAYRIVRTEVQCFSAVVSVIEVSHHLRKDHVRENRIASHRRILRVVVCQPGGFSHRHRINDRTFVKRIENFRIKRTALALQLRQNQRKNADPFNHVPTFIVYGNAAFQRISDDRQCKRDRHTFSRTAKAVVGQHKCIVSSFRITQSALHRGKFLRLRIRCADTEGKQRRFCGNQRNRTDRQRCDTAVYRVNREFGIPEA